MRNTLFFLLVSLAAAQPRMSAPVAGYVFDASARSIRAVVGVPGAASTGDRLPLNESFSAAFLHPALPLAVGIGKDGSLTTNTWKDPQNPQQSAIMARFAGSDRAVFAAAADQTLLLSVDGVELWSGLAEGSVTSVFSYTAGELGGVPLKAAVASDGRRVAVVLDSGRIVEVSADGVRALGEGKSVVFGAAAPDMFLLNAAGELSQLRDGTASLLASGLESDAELAVMSGFAGVIALSSGKGTLSMIFAPGGEVTRVDCPGCKPTRPQSLTARGMLYFEDDERGGMLLDNTTGGVPRIVPLAGIEARGNQ